MRESPTTLNRLLMRCTGRSSWRKNSVRWRLDWHQVVQRVRRASEEKVRLIAHWLNMILKAVLTTLLRYCDENLEFYGLCYTFKRFVFEDRSTHNLRAIKGMRSKIYHTSRYTSYLLMFFVISQILHCWSNRLLSRMERPNSWHLVQP